MTREEGESCGGEVYHLSFSSSGDELSYKLGDALAVFPCNDSDSVDLILEALSLTGNEVITSQRLGGEFGVRLFLTEKADLCRLSSESKKLFPQEEFMDREGPLPTLRELLSRYKCRVDLQEIDRLFKPLLPRFYSISSSPNYRKGIVDLTIRVVQVQGAYDSWGGVCSNYLCYRLDEGASISAYVQPSKHFTITEAAWDKPIIMIGSGTGIAPYRAFMQERLSVEAENVLFFGERKRLSHFYYEDFWEECYARGRLQTFLAFSREDQKTYVQDKVLEQRELVRRLCQEGAYIFVCGSKTLGTEVRKVLEEILGAEAFKQLRADKRYLVDVY